MEFLNFVHEKLKSLPLPPGVDVTSILNMVHGQLEAMGFPGIIACHNIPSNSTLSFKINLLRI